MAVAAKRLKVCKEREGPELAGAGEYLPGGAGRTRWAPRAPRARRPGSHLRWLPCDVCAESLSFLCAEELLVVELVSRALRAVVTAGQLWRQAFVVMCQRPLPPWRRPLCAPPDWKRFYFQYRRECGVHLDTKIPKSSAAINWRIPLPRSPAAFRIRSRELDFSDDALGHPIRWQIEVELRPGVAVFPELEHSPLPHPPPFFLCAPDAPPAAPPPVPPPGGAVPAPPPPPAAAAAPPPAEAGAPFLHHPASVPPLPAGHPALQALPPPPVAAAPPAFVFPGAAAETDDSPPPYDPDSSPLPAGARRRLCRGGAQHYHQAGLVRIWTTNSWTQDATRHYYGSHCTISIRDPLNGHDLQPESHVDIDNGHALEFDACILPATREMMLRVNLTLALEIAVPLNPFYARIAAANEESDAVKVGYCKAIFEVARCKRKSGGTFARRCDRNVHALIALASDPATGDCLRVEVLQALFNLLGPTSVFLADDEVAGLLGACFDRLRLTPVPCRGVSRDPQGTGFRVQLAQNALGSVFNLLAHPLSRKLASPDHLRDVLKLVRDDSYKLCHFSVVTVLLTFLSWHRLPADMLRPLARATAGFMEANDPLDSDCTGVAWDEADIAGFFLPLLRSPQMLCVNFAAWCLAKYYFPPGQSMVVPRRLMVGSPDNIA